MCTAGLVTFQRTEPELVTLIRRFYKLQTSAVIADGVVAKPRVAEPKGASLELFPAKYKVSPRGRPRAAAEGTGLPLPTPRHLVPNPQSSCLVPPASVLPSCCVSGVSTGSPSLPQWCPQVLCRALGAGPARSRSLGGGGGALTGPSGHALCV